MILSKLFLCLDCKWVFIDDADKFLGWFVRQNDNCVTQLTYYHQGIVTFSIEVSPNCVIWLWFWCYFYYIYRGNKIFKSHTRETKYWLDETYVENLHMQWSQIEPKCVCKNDWIMEPKSCIVLVKSSFLLFNYWWCCVFVMCLLDSQINVS